MPTAGGYTSGKGPTMKTMYAITHINKDGMRTLSRANQGRNHFDTAEEARAALETTLKNNSLDTLESIYGKVGATSMEVRPVRCYDHGDAMEIYFDNK